MRSIATLVLGAVALAGCSGNGDTAVAAAERQVEQAQQQLTDARTAADSATQAFCSSSASYIAALDRYGDVLNATATTVGDVKAAGRDLERPQQDALAAGTAAVEAQQAVDRAEQELLDAQARLDQLTSAASPAPSSSKGSSSKGSTSQSTGSSSTPPDQAVARVQQAEQSYATAVAGITDATPLRTASQQFNAAVVELEFAWLQLFNEAGCLTDESQQQAADAVHDYTVAIQQELAAAGYFDDKVDGVYGASTVAAIEELQQAHGLPVTGAMDAVTQAALTADIAAKGGAVAQQTLASTAAVQQTLKLLGYWDGPVDGSWTPALTGALSALQKDLDVPVTGTVDAATLTALEKAIADRGSPSPAPTTTVTVTATPSAPTATASPSNAG